MVDFRHAQTYLEEERCQLVWLRIVCDARVIKRRRITCFVDVALLEVLCTQFLNGLEQRWFYLVILSNSLIIFHSFLWLKSKGRGLHLFGMQEFEKFGKRGIRFSYIKTWDMEEIVEVIKVIFWRWFIAMKLGSPYFVLFLLAVTCCFS